MRGQAFDTFKLMIAAVVAVAILGILLGILGNISTPGADPASAIRQQLSKAYQYKGSTFVSSGEASFVAGTVYTTDTFTDAVGGSGVTLKFCAETTLTSNEAVSIGTDKDELGVEKDFRAKVKAKCTTDTSGTTCYIGIGDADFDSC
ncbi:hypothetical protein DRN74_00140 [Candidatus Micrarchaeota archaeon]|nr:MAG: hypothetical protein DRN74_00140 [Candidatus Micrarchaeota archaeon]